jgi:mycofactocin system glycosyltransferase
MSEGWAISPYPLRVMRLSSLTMRLLLLCVEERTCEELAQWVDLPVRRVEMLCEQLRWKGLLEAGPTRPPVIWPGVSIIVPSYNREDQLERCLRSLLELDYPGDCVEVIVVDDASTDGTPAMLQRMVQEFAAKWRVLHVVRHSRRQGVAISRNTGALYEGNDMPGQPLQLPSSDLLAYIDSDCVASPGWLAELVPAFQDVHVAAVGGMIRAYERESVLGRYEDVRSSLFMGVRAQQVQLEGPLKYLPTANLIVRRAVWQEVGGFAPLTFGEDVDFCRRLLVNGHSMLYLPQGVVYHDYRTRLWAFLSIRASYASAEATLLRRHPAERRILVLPPEQATFAGLVVGGVWGTYTGRFLGSGVQGRGPWRGFGGVPQASLSSAAGGVPNKPIRAKGVGQDCQRPGNFPLLSFLIAFLLVLWGSWKRMRKVQAQHLPIGPFTVFKATLRGHLAYTYHLCRHLTRYYTLLLLMGGLLLPPLLVLLFVMCSIVIGVDYVRLRPDMRLGQYALCSLLDDCAYEVGVVLGCIRHRTWRPLVPVITGHIPGP